MAKNDSKTFYRYWKRIESTLLLGSPVKVLCMFDDNENLLAKIIWLWSRCYIASASSKKCLMCTQTRSILWFSLFKLNANVIFALCIFCVSFRYIFLQLFRVRADAFHMALIWNVHKAYGQSFRARDDKVNSSTIKLLNRAHQTETSIFGMNFSVAVICYTNKVLEIIVRKR